MEVRAKPQREETGATSLSPGSSIRSTVPGGGYGNSSGTSMASPKHQCRIAVAESPDLITFVIKDAILSTDGPSI